MAARMRPSSSRPGRPHTTRVGHRVCVLSVDRFVQADFISRSEHKPSSTFGRTAHLWPSASLRTPLSTPPSSRRSSSRSGSSAFVPSATPVPSVALIAKLYVSNSTPFTELRRQPTGLDRSTQDCRSRAHQDDLPRRAADGPARGLREDVERDARRQSHP